MTRDPEAIVALLRTPDGQDLGEEMGNVLADLHARGVRFRRGDGTPLDAFEWHTESVH